MKAWLKYSIVTATVALLCGGVLILRHHSNEDKALIACRDMEISIKGEHQFVTEADVRAYILNGYGQVAGQKIDSIRLFRIEEMLDSKSAILKSEAWTTRDGILHVSIEQRNPVARFDRRGGGFYVDDRGGIFPLHGTYTAPVPVIEGSIPVSTSPGYRGMAPKPEERVWIGNILSLLGFMERNREWRDKFPTLSVGANGDIVLQPAEGREKFIFGPPDNFEAKFSRISEYYSRIAPSKEEGYYSSVNVKYNNQIVCRK